jgi:hypothetical protein
MVDRQPCPAMELLRAQPSGRSGPWWLATRWGKQQGDVGGSVLVLTQDGEASWWWGSKRWDGGNLELAGGAL